MKAQRRSVTSNEGFLLLAATPLQLLLAFDGVLDILVPLDQNEFDRTTVMCEASGVGAFLMFSGPTIHIVGDVYVVGTKRDQTLPFLPGSLPVAGNLSTVGS